ncbi:hypothetical protein A2U01_0049415, partial [Trifolium medium]|nr:hypothetical protein [Trifolium medium]
QYFRKVALLIMTFIIGWEMTQRRWIQAWHQTRHLSWMQP